MRFQLMHSALNINDWTKIHVSTFENMMKDKALPYDEAMLRTSISALEDDTNLKVLNLGNFRIDIENVAEINPTIAILKESLEIRTAKK